MVISDVDMNSRFIDHMQNQLKVDLHEESFTGKLFKHRSPIPSSTPPDNEAEAREVLSVMNVHTQEQEACGDVFPASMMTGFLCLN